jgi:hypothetical protein
MKNRRLQISAFFAFVLAIGVLIVAPHQAQADCVNFTSISFADCSNDFIGFIFNNIIQSVMVLWLTLSGTLLNAALVVTLNMSEIVNNAPIINSTWSIIRNFSSIIIIFFLLYTSILIIIGIGKTTARQIIINVIIAGLLINFSLFFTKVAIDASNIVSLAFYRAIAPGTNIDASNNYLGHAFNDGGITDVFMNAMKIQTDFAKQNPTSGQTTSPNPISTIAAAAGNSVIMFLAGLSFITAAMLFIIRTAILILLMAFSPVFFVGMIVPDLKDKISNRWRDWLVSQCVSMPVYLLLLYVAMKVMTNPQFQNFLNPSTAGVSGPGSGSALFSAGVTGTVLQEVLGIVLIMMPLIGALMFAGESGKWATNITNKIKGYGTKSLARGWQETGGRFASKVATSEGFKDLASRSYLGGALLKGTRGIAQGYNAKLDKQVKERTSFAESLGHDQRAMNTAQSYLRNLRQNLATAQATPGTSPATISTYRTGISNTERAITDLENRRKSSYANRINSKIIDAPWVKVGRKNKVGAAKILTDVSQKHLEDVKDKLKDTRGEIRDLQKAIRNNAPGIVGTPIPGLGTATVAQEAQLNSLLSRQQTQVTEVSAIEANLDSLKLTK